MPSALQRKEPSISPPLFFLTCAEDIPKRILDRKRQIAKTLRGGGGNYHVTTNNPGPLLPFSTISHSTPNRESHR